MKKFIATDTDSPLDSPRQSGTTSASGLVAMPKVGDMVGIFRLDSLLGEGGMGLVFKATETTLDRQVAIKFFNQNLLYDKPKAIVEELKRRFIREARLSAKINHPNLAQIYQAGLDASTPYFVMEYLEGETLEELLDRNPAQELARVCNFATQICHALRYAWETNQIIHRDLKPANIMVLPGDHVKLLDLGIAKVAETADMRSSGITRPGIGVGSPLYMAPEQHIGEPDVDQRGDIFAFGAILYRMLTLRLPFDGDSEYLLYTCKMEGAKQDIERWAPDTPPALSTMIYRMLEPNREQRLGKHDEILAVLHECLRTLPKGAMAGSKAASGSLSGDDRGSHGTARLKRQKTPPTLADMRKPDVESADDDLRSMLGDKAEKLSNAPQESAAKSPPKRVLNRPGTGDFDDFDDQTATPPRELRPPPAANSSLKGMAGSLPVLKRTGRDSGSNLRSSTAGGNASGPRSIPRKLNTVSTAQVKKSTEKTMLTESMRLRLKDPDLSITSDVIAQTRKPPTKTMDSNRAKESSGTIKPRLSAPILPARRDLQQDTLTPSVQPLSVPQNEARLGGLLKAKPLAPNANPSTGAAGTPDAPGGTPAGPSSTINPALSDVEYEVVTEEKEVFLPQMRELLEYIQPGMNLGDYQTIDLVGFGGMGAVYSGVHLASGQPVALKFLIADEMDDFNFRIHQIKNEAKIISRMDHPSIVKIHDMLQIQGLTFIVMDLFLGPHGRPVNLMDYAKSFGDANGLIAEDDLKSITLSLLRAISYAHSMGVVHCDLKPQNVLFDCVSTHANGQWDAYLMLTDFGLAKIVGEDLVLSSATASVDSFTGDSAIPDDAGALIGTFEYMSPEQRRGEPAAAPSDLFTVGIMMLRLLTGAKELGLRSRPSKLRPGIDRGWDKIILRALRENPEERFPSADAMAEAVTELPI